MKLMNVETILMQIIMKMVTQINSCSLVDDSCTFCFVMFVN